jgi:hypothetical protein
LEEALREARRLLVPHILAHLALKKETSHVQAQRIELRKKFWLREKN